MPLVVAPIDKKLKVIKIISEDSTKKHLQNLGIVVGSTLSIISICDGSVICMVKDGRLALDSVIATKIFVQEEV